MTNNSGTEKNMMLSTSDKQRPTSNSSKIIHRFFVVYSHPVWYVGMVEFTKSRWSCMHQFQSYLKFKQTAIVTESQNSKRKYQSGCNSEDKHFLPNKPELKIGRRRMLYVPNENLFLAELLPFRNMIVIVGSRSHRISIVCFKRN